MFDSFSYRLKLHLNKNYYDFVDTPNYTSIKITNLPFDNTRYNMTLDKFNFHSNDINVSFYTSSLLNENFVQPPYKKHYSKNYINIYWTENQIIDMYSLLYTFTQKNLQYICKDSKGFHCDYYLKLAYESLKVRNVTTDWVYKRGEYQYNISWILPSDNVTTIDGFGILSCIPLYDLPSACSNKTEVIQVDANVTSHSVTSDQKLIFAVNSICNGTDTHYTWSEWNLPRDYGDLANTIPFVFHIPLETNRKPYTRGIWLKSHVRYYETKLFIGFSVRYKAINPERIQWNCITKSNNGSMGNVKHFDLVKNKPFYFISDLLPYQVYSLEIKMHSIHFPTEFIRFGWARTNAQKPSSPTNVRVTSTDDTSIGLTWHPSCFYGTSKNYTFFCNGTQCGSLEVDKWVPDTNKYTIHNLKSFTVYTIEVQACNEVECSWNSEKIVNRTGIGIPSKIWKPNKLLNETRTTLKWTGPSFLAAPADVQIFEIKFTQLADPDDIYHLIYVSEQKCNIRSEFCTKFQSTNATAFRISIRAVNVNLTVSKIRRRPNIFCEEDELVIDGGVQLFQGDWSHAINFDCPAVISTYLTTTITLISLIVVVICVLIIKKVGKKIYRKFEDISVELPIGLTIYPAKRSSGSLISSRFDLLVNYGGHVYEIPDEAVAIPADKEKFITDTNYVRFSDLNVPLKENSKNKSEANAADQNKQRNDECDALVKMSNGYFVPIPINSNKPVENKSSFEIVNKQEKFN